MLNQSFSLESLSHSLMPTDRHLPSTLAIWSEILCHSCVLLALVCSYVGGARLKPASVLGILHPAWLERQKGDLGGIRRAVLWARSGSQLSCGTERDWWEVEKVPAIAWHTTVPLVPPRDHALRRVLGESTFDFKTETFQQYKYKTEHARKLSTMLDDELLSRSYSCMVKILKGGLLKSMQDYVYFS